MSLSAQIRNIIKQLSNGKIFGYDDLRIPKVRYTSAAKAFRIASNLSGGFSDYSHQFVLDISKRDKEQIIKKITSAENFQPSLE